MEQATIIITSRPHACEKLDADRRIEVVGFGKEEIQEFVENSFPNDMKSVKEFSWQLNEYPHLESLSYVPMNLVMIVDIFKCNNKKLPSTITQLYQMFIVMTLQRQVRKENERKQVCLAVTSTDNAKKLHKVLAGVPEEAVRTLLPLCRLAFCGLFDWHSSKEEKLGGKRNRNPKIIFTATDIKECEIEVTAEWDGYGLLKATHIHKTCTDTITYSFSHLTIQEFLCAVYISTLSEEKQQHLLSEHFNDYCNVFMFLCGITGLKSIEMFKIVYSKLSNSTVGYDSDVIISALKCLYESQLTSPPISVKPISLDMPGYSLQPYDRQRIFHVLSCIPVSHFNVAVCYIADKGAELLSSPTSQQMEELDLSHNDLTIDGLVYVMETVKTSKPY